MNKSLILKAAELLKKNCVNNIDNEYCHNCPLLYSGMCMVSNGEPYLWDLSYVQGVQEND